jgi:uncharacterized protein (DUF2344 family)
VTSSDKVMTVFFFEDVTFSFDEMIENRKYNIGVIDNKTGDILANIEEVRDVVMKHLNEVADKIKEKVTSSKKNTVITLSDEVTELSSINDMLTFLLQFIGQVHSFR